MHDFVLTPEMLERYALDRLFSEQITPDNVSVITQHTGKLESMQYSDKPTRAEIFDVCNAIADGSDYLMLSGETSNGKHPALVVKTLAELIKGYKGPIRSDPPF